MLGQSHFEVLELVRRLPQLGEVTFGDDNDADDADEGGDDADDADDDDANVGDVGDLLSFGC